MLARSAKLPSVELAVLRLKRSLYDNDATKKSGLPFNSGAKESLYPRSGKGRNPWVVLNEVPFDLRV